MRQLLTSLAGISMLMLVSFTTPVPATDLLSKPDAVSIEKLLRESLAKDEFEIPSLNPYKNAVLIEFGLVDLERVSSSRWHAEVEMLFDLGPPPPSIVGFERIRWGRYRLVLKRQGKQLELLRFTPVAQVHPLPARY